MSETLKKIEEFKKSCLRELLNQCTEAQKKMFDRIYPNGIDKMTDEKMSIAIQQCERTIKLNVVKKSEGVKDDIST